MVIASRQERGPTAQERLYENLLANYSKSSRPVNDPRSAVNLSFTFELLKIYEVVSDSYYRLEFSRIFYGPIEKFPGNRFILLPGRGNNRFCVYEARGSLLPPSAHQQRDFLTRLRLNSKLASD